MSYDYDGFYRDNPHGLGAPTKEFVDFFATYDGPAQVLDVGCGQGRDALFIARLGHSVVGVDLSPAGIADLKADAAAEGLAITGVVADIQTYTPDGVFDVVLIDRTLHMLLDTAERHAAFATLIAAVGPGGSVLVADERSNMEGLKSVIAQAGGEWDTLKDKGGFLFLKRRY